MALRGRRAIEPGVTSDVGPHGDGPPQGGPGERGLTSPPPTGDAAAEAGTWAVVGRPRYRPAFIALTLFFTIFPLLSVLRHPPAPIPFALLLVGWVVFAIVLVPLFRGHRFGRAEDTRWVAIAALLLTSIAFVVQVVYGDGNAATLYFYAGVTAARLIPDRLAMLGIVGVAIATAIGTGLLEGDWAGAVTLAVTVGAISLTISAMSALGRTNRELEATRRELADLAVRHERDRIARDLHDTLGHALSLIALKSELARRLLPGEPERAAAEIGDVERVARESLAAVRETVSGYRQPTLAGELASAREAFAAAGIECPIPLPPPGLARDVETVLAWAVREGVTNVLRHSEARSARIRFSTEEGAVSVEVVDDGPGPPSAPAPSGAGMGLAGLRERAASLGGGVDAAPLPGGGFRLRVSVPVAGVA
jgi:two-component system sensor histidine kinase DesK